MARPGPHRFDLGGRVALPATYAADVREQTKKTNAMYDELLTAQREFADRLLDVLAPVS